MQLTRPGGSLDHAGFELFELLLVISSHALEQVKRGMSFLLVDLRDRKADVDQHPITGLNTAGRGIEKTDVHVAAYAGNFDLRKPVLAINDFDDLTWDCQTHGRSSTTTRGESQWSSDRR